VIATLMNHSVQTAADVKDRLGARLLAVVPDASGKKPPKAKVAKQPKVKPAKQPKEAPAPTPPRAAQVKPLKPATVRKAGTPAAASARSSSSTRRVSRASGSAGWPN
jgi:hypothetical protein